MIIFENATIQMRGIPDCIFLCIEQGHLFSIIILQCPDLSFVWVEVLVKVLVNLLVKLISVFCPPKSYIYPFSAQIK